jgi:serine protease AprX
MRTLLFLIALISFSSLTAQSFSSKIDPSVYAAAQTGKTDFFILLKEQADLSKANNLISKEEKGTYVFTVLRGLAQASQSDIKNYLSTQDIDFQSFWIVNGVFAKGDINHINAIAARADVAHIIGNTSSILNIIPNTDLRPALETRDIATITYGLSRIKADSVWGLGFKGKGVVIAGEDTGYDWEHPAIKPKYRGWNAATQNADHNYNWFDAIHANPEKKGNPCGYDTPMPCDDNNHGTHTMGTMLGSTDSLFLGVAPEAKWIAARNMDNGNGTLMSYVECFQWFLAPTDLGGRTPNPKLAPHVINNSWYCSREEGCNESNFAILEQAVNACRAAGIVVVVSAGNSGSACSSVEGPPAFFQKSFSVGATRADDTIAGFSSRGPVTIDGSNRLKPNVSAPGVSVLSSIKGGRYAQFSGTSMAGPHVAGTVALMISANPKLAGQVDTIERILEQTAKPMTTTQNCGAISGTSVPNHTYGYGRIDALAAVKKALLYTPKLSQTIENQGFIKVYPNPFKDELTLYTEGVSGETIIDIFNIKGQLVFNKKDIFKGENMITLYLNTLPQGIYFYKLKNEKTLLTGKIIKQ